MSQEVLTEEFEVLESIYPTEVSKLSERWLQIVVEPEEDTNGDEPVILTLDVRYPDAYPDELPELSIETVEGDVDEEEIAHLLGELRSVGEENVGIAMTFTLVSHLREQLAVLVKARAERRRKEEMEKERLVLEAEEAKTRGTQVTLDSFKAWKAKYDKEQAVIKAREDEEKMKGMTPKERDEYKKLATRLSGRQLFERNKDLDADDSLLEEGAVSVDVSQYEREVVEDEEDEDRVTFSDSE